MDTVGGVGNRSQREPGGRPWAAGAMALVSLFLLAGTGAVATEPPAPSGVTIHPQPANAPDWSTLPPGDFNAPPVEQQVSYEVGTHRAIAEVAVRRGDCNADAYLKNDLLITQGISLTVSGKSMIVKLQDGAQNEDESYLIRPFNHFYDPITNSGIRDFAVGINSLQWAWDSGSNNEDWGDTRTKFFDAVTLPSRTARNAALAETFFRLGHVIHLVEDLGQPQHTRNDAHKIGADYETYCLANYATYGTVLGLGSEGIPSFSGGTSPIAGIPPEFAGHWDTEQYTGQAGFTSFGSTPGLAEYSNAYFITDDTMFGNTRLAILPRAGAPSLTVLLTDALDNFSSEPRHIYPHPHLRNTNLASFFPAGTRFAWIQREGVGLAGATHYIDLNVRNGSGAVVHTTPNLCLINADNEIGFDNVCYDSWAHQLIPKAVSYSAGLINYFFRGKIGLDNPTTTWDTGAKKNQVVIRNDSNEAFGNGQWKLYYDDVNGNRTQMNDLDVSAYSGLAPGATFTAKFPELLCDGGYAFTLVFKGQIGNEPNAVAAKSFYTADEVWSGTHYIPSGSEQCFDVTGQTIAIFHRPTPAGYDIVGWLQFVGSSDLFQVTGTCNNDQLQFGFSPDCGNYLSGGISGSTLTNGQSCCWYCPLDPPPTGPWFCGTVSGMERIQ